MFEPERAPKSVIQFCQSPATKRGLPGPKVIFNCWQGFEAQVMMGVIPNHTIQTVLTAASGITSLRLCGISSFDAELLEAQSLASESVAIIT